MHIVILKILVFEELSKVGFDFLEGLTLNLMLDLIKLHIMWHVNETISPFVSRSTRVFLFPLLCHMKVLLWILKMEVQIINKALLSFRRGIQFLVSRPRHSLDQEPLQ